jgi:hypothetical protein
MTPIGRLLVPIFLLGCHKTVGPVVTSVSVDGSKLHYTRCDLVVGTSGWNVGDDSLEHCVDELGRPVTAP